ncbi:MAG TPA: alkaline phosphatase family protein [Jatrophihabitans sp.]|uniref:alkaline phosphatase family protein n=1 Tax=Jatrophihabitans sp. TaxID=1932789 RepID=UPI002E00F66A|nr:alkaline phosphatase family protein [Jatrophihabitans sp.]
MTTLRTRSRGAKILAGLAGIATAASLASTLPASASPSDHPSRPGHITLTASGTPVGAVKHVWLIILENKSYDATFTGLNQNSYLWKTLPSQGALLTKYYGTGHFSLDNYTSMVSGQGPAPADQNDCPVYADQQGSVISDTARQDGPTTDRGQFAETGAPYANPVPGGANEGAHGGTGCVYPAAVPTLFNQFDAAGVSWKGYAQDLGNPDATGPAHAVNKCGGPGDPSGAGVTNPGGANATDQYVPKHFPFPWFESLLSNPADCSSSQIANLDSNTGGLVHDLQSEATTPAFSWITPNNCSDAHDAVCAGNNLSGAFDNTGKPVYAPTGKAAYQPEATTPTNYTGGLYASDLFLKYYIPLIEQSAAFRDGGLIDVTFDEANPPFANSSFNDANNPGSTAGVSTPATAAGYARSDAAGESFDTRHGPVSRAFEPTGPNTPLLQDANGNQVYPGPGDSAFIDRPAALTGDPVNDPMYLRGGGNLTPGARTDSVGVGGITGTNTIIDPNVTAPDAGRSITGTGIPANACVGPVTDAGPRFDTGSTSAPVKPASNPADKAYVGSFQVVDCTTNSAAALTGDVPSVTLAAETSATDPLFSSTIETPGGGDTGSVLISPLIKPGTVSSVSYNHYSWLRTMEDLFQVAKGDQHDEIPAGAGSVSRGLDGRGHLGFAAQPDLRTFGLDVFTNVRGRGRGGFDDGR